MPPRTESQAVKHSDRAQDPRLMGIVGLGLDNTDDHQRITRTENFLLVGGSAETHERMQDTAIHFDEALERRGKTLQEASAEEALDLLREAMDR